MNLRFVGSAAVFTMAVLSLTESHAQTSDTENAGVTVESEPAATENGGEVPPIEIIQPGQEIEPTPAVEVEVRPDPRPRPVRRPVTASPVMSEPAPAFDIPNQIVQPLPGYYGPPGGQAAHERAMNSAQSPINPLDGIAPGNLQDFSSAADRVTREDIEQQDPLTTNDILQRVPGVAVINDDGLGRHGGVSVRGSPARRSRKVLVMEDGRSINLSLWLDPSVHYVPPPERLESVEVVRGSVIYGPNNNYGVVNFRNLSPFGPTETEVSGQVGVGGYEGAKWHTHTRRSSGNWGTVVSYTGANAEGAWNTERLRYNDFYAALGWKGIRSDFVFSAVYFRQRDTYDETNFTGDDDDRPGLVERTFFRDIKHCKSCFEPLAKLNTFNADVVLMQGVYNYYLDADTTVTARAYGQSHRRDRFFAPNDPKGPGTSFRPFFSDGEAFVPDEGGMRGRLRTYTNFGTEIRAELANRPLMFGLSQDMQFGFRYERNDFVDRRTEGRQGKILGAFDDPGITIRRTKHEADAFSGFFQTEIPVTPVLSVVPAVRVDHYRISRAKTRSERDDVDLDSCPVFGGQPCTVIDFEDPSSESFDRTHVLPGVSFAYTKLPDTTFYGGYHRGLTMAVLRSVAFPPGDELGDNYEIGVRSTAIRGMTFDVAGFHKNISDFQIKGSTTDVFGNDVFTLIDEVHVNGVEMYSRLDTAPFTGSTINPYLEGTFTYSESTIERGFNEDGQSVAGNLVPEVPREQAYLTAGIESQAGWNASVSWIYRGAFFTDESNTPFAGDPTGEEGKVPSVWLLAARANYTIPDTNAQVFVSGQNLTDKLYITDRADGIKPGIGRTIMAGARLKW